ncbi:LAETG motif-containing sortase-dependent surface protein [Streptomyces sp. NPDC101166]|uniref:LAETG motif-containing sortase-dependent surface protein n=1 Tax=Streptomyces sp. NPDC101166 TaxID=3366120 RepID=UPI003821D435
MPPSRRTAARSVRMLGVTAASAAFVLGASGSALAGDIADFSASAACDGTKGVITVTDKDKTAIPAVVTVFLQNNNADLRQVGEPQTVIGSAKGTTVVFAEEWEPGAEYRVHITAVDADLNADIEPNLTTPAKGCKSDNPNKPDTPAKPGKPTASGTPSAPATTPSSTPSGTASGAATPGTPSPSASASASASADDSSAPADTGSGPASSNAPSPGLGESNLAETGSGAPTGAIVGIAAALLALGGGAVFYGMRRRGADNH